MKIRYKIALLITSAGILVSLIFSVFIFCRMTKVTYAYIDQELRTINLILDRLISSEFDQNRSFKPEDQFPEINLYLVRIYDSNRNLIYENGLARGIQFPSESSGKNRYTTALPVPKSRWDLDPDNDGEVTVRVRKSSFTHGGLQHLLQIAKPIEKMDRQFAELAWIVATGFITASILITIMSYFLAGLIIKPISQVNRFATGIIDDKTIAQRLPLGKNRDELYILSDTLNRMFNRLQYSFKRQKQFIANASHEFKSPLAVALLFLEKAVQRDDLPEHFRNELIQHYDSVLRMRRLVKSLLDLAAMELTDRVELSRFCAANLLNTVLEDYKALSAEKEIRISFDHPPELIMEGDKDKINRLFINLLDNAVKYCSEVHGEIVIRLTEENRNSVSLSIQNNGLGISQEDIPHVFEQFYRAEKSRSPKYGGTGLGLALVKRIVDLHKGSISIESQLGIHTRVYLTLPKYQSNGPRASA